MTFAEFSETPAIQMAQKSHCCLIMCLLLNINQSLAAPPPIPVDSDSEISDFNDTEEEPEPGSETRLHPCYYLR